MSLTFASTASPSIWALAADSRFWMPENASLHGASVDWLMRVNLIALGICFLVSHLLIGIAIFRRSRKAHVPTAFWMESVPMVLLCLLYAWMAISAQRLWALNRFEGASPGALQVEVVGEQFQWYFRYPGVDAKFGTVRPELAEAAAGNPLGLDRRDPASAPTMLCRARWCCLPGARWISRCGLSM